MKLPLTNPTSLQDYYDRTVAYLRSQEEPSVDPATSKCVYLSPDGNRCSVGAWIPDYHPAIGERLDVFDLIYHYPDLDGMAWPSSNTGRCLAYFLQKAHDQRLSSGGNIYPLDEDFLLQIASEFGLVYMSPSQQTAP